ncbi:hypothetical protein PXH69_24545 [Rhodococcus qingshengii]|uniref:Uncharacterized protein n=1 Tax=Rhodococcus qingshengii TaxID=334542 RepID=A0AAW6LSA6_RHOSG|nr:hypothetical protein [Rhodococcus qingshengii]MDE8648141.1 hypothetical protein [Rhodococcus qingshengii]
MTTETANRHGTIPGLQMHRVMREVPCAECARVEHLVTGKPSKATAPKPRPVAPLPSVSATSTTRVIRFDELLLGDQVRVKLANERLSQVVSVASITTDTNGGVVLMVRQPGTGLVRIALSPNDTQLGIALVVNSK